MTQFTALQVIYVIMAVISTYKTITIQLYTVLIVCILLLGISLYEWKSSQFIASETTSLGGSGIKSVILSFFLLKSTS